MSDLFATPLNQLPQVDAVVQAAMQWHFNPRTGSPFWLRRRQSLGFDPLVDVRTVDDLRRFPDVSALWRTVPAEDLIPQGCREDDWAFQVFESGGTTGEPKRIVEMTSRRRGVEWVSTILDRHGLPGTGDGNWLHIGPAGPHAVGRSVGILAHLRRSLCYYLDFDPRWVKRCVREGHRAEVVRYVDHVLDQAVDILKTQNVSVIFATPPVLEAAAARPDVWDLFRRKARGLIWSGTSISPETLRLLEEEFFPEARVVGLYGNTMMGIACQRPREAGDAERCVFQAFHPYCLVDVVNPEDPSTPVAYGEEGQVRVTVLSRDLFLPNTLERDRALRLPPGAGFTGDGVARIRPLAREHERIIEGVY